MASPEYLEWLNSQPHKPEDKITNWQKLTSRFLPPKGVKTWGEWYSAEGVSPVQRKETVKKTTSKQVSSKVDILKRKTQLLKLQITNPGIGKAEQNRLIEEFKTAQDDLLDAEKELLETQVNEGKLKESDANKKAQDILRFDVRRLRERRDLVKRLGQPTEDIDKELTAKEEDLKKIIKPSGVVESSFGPPQVRGGVTVAGTGGAVTPTETTATTPVETPIKTPLDRSKPGGQKGITGSTSGTGGASGTGGLGDKDKNKKGKGKEDFQAVLATAESLYGAIDEVFKSDEDLKALLRRAVGAIDDPDDNFSVDRFISELSNTAWFKSNAGAIRQRGFFKRQYDALQQQIKTDDPNYQSRLEELDKTSEYGRGLANTIQKVKEEARTIGRQIDDTTARVIATNLYNYANELDDVKIRNAVLGAGKFTVGGITTGEAGVNKQTLLTVARANGLDLDKNFGEATINTWLDRIAQGESIETIKNLIRQTAKTTWQVDDRVGALLDQGVDLQTVYSPFRKEMATILELPEDEITIDQLSKKGLFGGQKPMNLYDFRRSLRQDDRWQYTEGARTEMAALTENLLRDFGFVG
jgi:hypothetical protein